MTRTTKQSFWKSLAQRYQARRTMHRRVPWLGFTLSLINIVAIAFFVLDAPLGQTAKNLSPQLFVFAGGVTDVGRLIWILVAALTVLSIGILLTRRLTVIRRRFRTIYFLRMAFYVALSVTLTSAIVNALKSLIGRARPPLYDQEGLLSFHPMSADFLHQSFPSAHSANIGALFMSLALLFPRFRLLFLSLALWVGATRIIIGVHYPSDVAAGLGVGAWLAFAIAFLFARFGYVFSVGFDGVPKPRLNRLI